ncbi:MAG TPA: right-handed parallel beta-helix repeat-containing protein, partial [Anaerolineae bacterium]|nr:right-handed parallel beta-helix repeat-containing protein [Anaerolineae bacterium]
MRKATLLGICVLFVCVFVGPAVPGAAAPANVLEVGTSSTCAYHTIADAIAAAQPGDTIKVQATTYSEPALVVDKDLTLAGGYHTADPYGCLTITGVGYTTYQRAGTTAAPAIRVQNAALTMTWFIVELNAYGSGVQVVDGEATLANVIVRDNDATWGGGVRAVRSRVTLRNSEVSDNRADFGGGLHAADGSTVVAENTLIRANQGWELGAGVSLHTGSTFTGLDWTTIESNVTPFGCNYGGGIYAAGAGTEVLLDEARVVSNTALLRGGGIYLTDGAAATLRNMARVGENRAFGPASGAGGGVLVNGAGTVLVLDTAVITANWADPVGGGVASLGGTVHAVGAIVTENSARSAGGGIYNEG